MLALPRGGVPVAREVADRLGAPLDVLVARKIGAPGQPELGIGAIAEGGAVVGSDMVRALRLSVVELERLAEREQVELDRRVDLYRGGRPRPPVRGRDVVLVDDGLATGVTAEAALRSLRAREPARLVLAVPVAEPRHDPPAGAARRRGGLRAVASRSRRGRRLVRRLHPDDRRRGPAAARVA